MAENSNSLNLQRMPPQNLDAEMLVLGAILIEPKEVMPIAKVRADDFYKTAHGEIFTAMKTVFDRGDDIDLVTVTDQARKSKGLENMGGASYLATLVSFCPTAANYKSHEKLVMNAATLRRAIHACNETLAAAYNLEEPDSVISKCVTLLNDIRMGRGDVVALSYRDIAQIGFAALERNYEASLSGKLTGITTGFAGIDELTNGLQKSWFYILAGRTGKGKTSLAMQMARGAGKSGRKVGVISVEMDPEQLAIREISSESQVPLKRLTSGKFNDQDWTPMSEAAGRLSELPIWGVFTAFTAEAVEQSMNYLVQVHGVELVFVDYLQLLSLEDHSGTREQEVSKISRMHKRKAKELHIPVVALAQLNRGIEGRTDKRPMLSDLRESGSLEQDADVVAFIHHDECKCPLEVQCLCGNRYKAWYLQRKGRMNGTGDVELGWQGRTTTFVNKEA